MDRSLKESAPNFILIIIILLLIFGVIVKIEVDLTKLDRLSKTVDEVAKKSDRLERRLEIDYSEETIYGNKNKNLGRFGTPAIIP